MYVRTYWSAEKIGEDVKAARREIKKKRIPSDRQRLWRAGSFVPPRIATGSSGEVRSRSPISRLSPFAAEEKTVGDWGGMRVRGTQVPMITAPGRERMRLTVGAGVEGTMDGW